MAYRGGRATGRGSFGRRQSSPDRSSIRRVVSAGSPSDGTLSSRFARIHSESRSQVGRRGGPNRVGKAARGRRGGRGPAAMEIDSVGGSSAGGRRGRGGRGSSRGSGRGGNRGGRRPQNNKNKQPMSKDSLDDDLDNYMMKDTTLAKSRLDQEMDAYQQARAH